MKNFRTYQLAIEFYHLSRNLSLRGDARDQLDRAARSVVLNLAEGRGRATVKDQKRFFTIALGSLRESQAILELEMLQNTTAFKILDKVGGSLYLLIKNAKEF